MKKINSYSLSKQKNVYKNLWRRNKNNAKQQKMRCNEKINSLSLFKEYDLHNNTNK
jgi:hypothetical protein